MTTVTGSVERIVYRGTDNGYCVAKLAISDASRGEESVVTIVGTLPDIREGESLELEGEWQVHPVHGRDFRVHTFQSSTPSTVAGIERYLASGAVSGIGPVTASKLVDHFGDRVFDVLDTEPHLLIEVAGITEKRSEVIVQSWSEHRSVRNLSMFLQEHGLSLSLATRLHKKYGDNAIAVLSADPYTLARDIDGIGFRTADAIGRKLGVSPTSVSRFTAGIRHVLSEAADEGHVFLPFDDLYRRAGMLLETTKAMLEPALLESCRHSETVVDSNRVYLGAFFQAEVGVAKALQELNSTPSSLTLDRTFDPVAATRAAADAQGLELAREQVAATEQALYRKVSILTGGPGTGKTSTLRTIIAVLQDADIDFCLCAPTGRAAKRVAEATGQSASTIHRLLEYQPGMAGFGFDQSNPLPYDFVIVDEVSMLDLVLFYHLLKAIPREAHLLLVGDADQLPSVGAGSVLKDCLGSAGMPVVTLTQLFRQSRTSKIVQVAHAIIHGNYPNIENGPEDDMFFITADDEARTVAVIKHLLAERIPNKFGFDPVEDVQVIAPMHAGVAGVIALNNELQAMLNPNDSKRPEVRRGDRLFRLGDKVMQTRNDYDKDVYNGDVGKLASIDVGDGVVKVRFPTPGGAWMEVPYAIDEIDELTLAYAVSVHKAQGSEFPCVLMPIVPRHAMMLQRSLLYTAVTRASRLCVLVGSSPALQRAIDRQPASARNSNLAERLSARVDVQADRLL